MLIAQILNLLKKISGQLDEISRTQQIIKAELLLLHEEFLVFD
jgi:hypothetical protein